MQIDLSKKSTLLNLDSISGFEMSQPNSTAEEAKGDSLSEGSNFEIDFPRKNYNQLLHTALDKISARTAQYQEEG